MASIRRLNMCVAATLTISTATALQAGEITGFIWYPGVTSVAGTVIDPAPTPNDNVVGDSTYEIFVTQKDYSAIGPVDIEFSVSDNGGDTEYIFREGVDNSTGITWGSYHIELGFGNGTGFTKSLPDDGLDFDTPHQDSLVDFDPPTPGFFPFYSTPTEDDIIATGGTFPDGNFSLYFFFHVDVPDGIESFTLRQSPIARGSTIPEPSTLALAALGLMSLGVFARRKRRRA